MWVTLFFVGLAVVTIVAIAATVLGAAANRKLDDALNSLGTGLTLD